MNKYTDFIFEDSYTKEMEDWFIERTERHIKLVNKYAKKIMKERPDIGLTQERIDEHDKSKYSDKEKIPYIFISWYYKMLNQGKEFKIPANIKERMNEASYQHVISNKHHPEYYDADNIKNNINEYNRDKSDFVVDGRNMDNISLAEMVADWCSVSFEVGKNTPLQWFEDNKNVKWKFTDEQEEFIYDMIKTCW